MKPAVSLRLEDFPRALAWSPDGRVLATGGEDGRLVFWDAAGPARAEARPGSGWVEHLAWAPAGEALAVAAGRQLGFFRADGAALASPPPLGGTITALAWWHDGSAVAAATYGAVLQFKPGETAPLEVLVWKSAYVSLAWSGDGRHLVAGTQESNLIYWPLPFRDEQPLHMSGYAAKVKHLGFDARSRWLATGGGQIVTVWNMAGRGPAGSRPRQLEGHDAKVTALAWSPDDRRLAVASADGTVFIAT